MVLLSWQYDVFAVLSCYSRFIRVLSIGLYSLLFLSFWKEWAFTIIETYGRKDARFSFDNSGPKCLFFVSTVLYCTVLYCKTWKMITLSKIAFHGFCYSLTNSTVRTSTTEIHSIHSMIDSTMIRITVYIVDVKTMLNNERKPLNQFFLLLSHVHRMLNVISLLTSISTVLYYWNWYKNREGIEIKRTLK